jgi:hypothetical protein
LLVLDKSGYALSGLGRRFAESLEPRTEARLRLRAFIEPPLYAELCRRFSGKRLPESAALANWLHHHHQITSSAQQAAAELFVASARQAGMLGDDGVLRPEPDEAVGPRGASSAPIEDAAASKPGDAEEVEFSLRLRGSDDGKTIRVCAPDSMSRESFERLLQALRLHVRIEDDGEASTA